MMPQCAMLSCFVNQQTKYHLYGGVDCLANIAHLSKMMHVHAMMIVQPPLSSPCLVNHQTKDHHITATNLLIHNNGHKLHL